MAFPSYFTPVVRGVRGRNTQARLLSVIVRENSWPKHGFGITGRKRGLRSPE